MSDPKPELAKPKIAKSEIAKSETAKLETAKFENSKPENSKAEIPKPATSKPANPKLPNPPSRESNMPAVAGLAIAVVLLVVGLWLAHELRAASKMQDCVLSGRTNCNEIQP
jgi:hypothetical protein